MPARDVSSGSPWIDSKQCDFGNRGVYGIFAVAVGGVIVLGSLLVGERPQAIDQRPPL